MNHIVDSLRDEIVLLEARRVALAAEAEHAQAAIAEQLRSMKARHVDELTATRTRHRVELAALATPAAQVELTRVVDTLRAARKALAVLDPSVPPPSESGKAPTVPRETPAARDARLREVAKIARAAKANGQLVVAALAEHFDRPPSTVKNWIHDARKAGLLDEPAVVELPPERPRPTATSVPASVVSRSAPQMGGKVLVCRDCDLEFSLGDMAKLTAHCRADHQRLPTQAERTPTAIRGAA
jgi:hypothetical protein